MEAVVVAQSFEEFYRAHRSVVAQLAWLLTHDRAVSEDIAQEAFLALYQRFDAVEHPAAYLRRSVVNAVYQRTRRLGREQRRNGLVTAGQAVAVDGPSGGVLDAVAGLPLNQRTAVVLRYWGGLTDSEIAASMGLRPGSVRSLLSRASARLRKELS